MLRYRIRRVSMYVCCLVLGLTGSSLSWALSPWDVATGWTVQADAWLAGASKFDEQPGPGARGHVWGKFDTNFYSFSVAKDLAWGLQAELDYGSLTILPNTMYLHSEETLTKFDGEGTQLLPQLNYHIVQGLGTQLDFGVGYQQVSAVKHFRDFQQNGVVLRPGNWGDYKIQYSGWVYVLRGKVGLPLGLSLGGEILGSPVVNNRTEVTGYGDVMREEAKGLRYRWEGYAAYSPLPLLKLALGYRYEDLYFPEPKPESFSLAIVYGGPFLNLSFEF